jgi:nocturnin
MIRLEAMDASILHRDWRPIAAAEEKTAAEVAISVLQFNVLADHSSDAFPFCHAPAEALPWAKRGPRLTAALLQAGTDLICLEECDHYADWFEPQLRAAGYGGFFVKKNSDENPDGTAVFYREAALRLVAHASTPLRGTQNAVFAHFETSVGARNVFLSATHLKAKAGFEERRRDQGRTLLQAFNAFIAEREAQSANPPAVIVCGDFNDEPSSLVVAEMLAASGPALPSSLRSALDHYPAQADHEPIFTTFKMRTLGYEQKRIIDYVFYSPAALRVVDILHMPTIAELPDRLPCIAYPSDHIACGVRFAFVA